MGDSTQKAPSVAAMQVTSSATASTDSYSKVLVASLKEANLREAVLKEEDPTHACHLAVGHGHAIQKEVHFVLVLMEASTALVTACSSHPGTSRHAAGFQGWVTAQAYHLAKG